MSQSFAINDFIQPAEDLPGDITAAACRFLQAHPKGGWELQLGGGQRNLYPEIAPERQLFVSNNDSGLARSPFMLRGIRDAVIDGQEAQLLVRATPAAGSGEPSMSHTPMVPFVLEDCHNVTLRNFSVDWKTPDFAQGVVQAVAPGQFDVEMQAEMRWWVWNGKLSFDLEGIVRPLQRLFIVDTATGDVVGGANCDIGWDCNWMVTQLDDKHARFTGPAKRLPLVGQTAVFYLAGNGNGRRSSVIFANRCENITVENVTLYQAGGMGLIAQWSKNITVRKMVVEARPGSGRLFSLSADAVHFASCRGHLLVEDSRFQNQFDDAINAHGLYCQITRRLNATTVRGHRIQVEQQGQEVARPGDRVEFIRFPSLEILGTGVVKALHDWNSETVDVEFEGTLPDDVGPNVFFEDLDWQPDLTIRRCIMQHSRPRGVLPSTRGKVVIEQCYFETTANAILIPVGSSIGESGRVADVLIRDNRFVNCSRQAGPLWGGVPNAPITITREKKGDAIPTEMFHHNIRIENNIFDRPNGPAVSAYCVDGLVFRDNQIQNGPEESPVMALACRNITVE